MQDIITKKIKEVVWNSDLEKGENYPQNYILPLNYITFTNDAKLFKFKVQSQNTRNIYKCEVLEQNGKIIKTNCTCPKFESDDSCKHIASILINYANDIFELTKEERNLTISKKILSEFCETKKKNKEQVHLEIVLEEQTHTNFLLVRLKIGFQKNYVLTRILEFFDIYENQKGTILFGKSFTYNPLNYYFQEEDEKILHYLLSICKYAPYKVRGGSIYLASYEKDELFNLLKNRSFEIRPYGKFNGIEEENPFETKLMKEKDAYLFEIKDLNQITFLDDKHTYLIKDNKMYHIPLKLSQFIEKIYQHHIHQLYFEEEDFNTFGKGIYPLFENKVKTDTTLQEKLTIINPNVQLYFDYTDVLECKLYFLYNNQKISFSSETSSILRNESFEEEVIQELTNLSFKIKKDCFLLEDFDKIGDFFENTLPILTEKYETFTTDKMKNIKFIKKVQLSSHFSIGQDNIFHYQFDLGDIKIEELPSIVEQMHKNKKYYRMKNGNLLSLQNNQDLSLFQNFLTDFSINSLEEEGIIPKYRILYLDSLKSQKYSFLKTDNSFDLFVKNFKQYKDVKIHLNKKDKQILRNYQITGIQWLYQIYKCEMGSILADEMGLGKSLQVICFLKEVLKENKKAKILIIAPTSLIYNWQHEFDKYGSELSYQVIADTKKKRNKLMENNKNIFITTYGLARRDFEIYQEMFFEVVVLDEAQNIKNPFADTTKALKKIPSKTRFALTGTPIENSVVELWSIFDFLMPGFFPSLPNFQNRYKIKEMNDEEKERLETLKLQINPFILRRLKKEVIKELPEKLENNIYLELTNEQKKLYASQVEKTRKEMDELIQEEGFQKARFKILQLLTRLRQICIDPRILFEDYQGGSTKIENLIPFVKDIIKSNHKILIFTSYKTALELVKQELEKENITSYTIDGSVSSKKRMELVNSFNQDNTNVFLIMLKAGGTGLNLTGADVVIHLDLWWNPQAENQATDRAHRIGQKNIVQVIRLICKDTIEERILELQQKKKLLSDALIEGELRDQNVFSSMNEEDIQKLLAYGEDI